MRSRLHSRLAALAVAGALAVPGLAHGEEPARPALVETPTLAATHPAGLPPIEDRVPLRPAVIDLTAKGREIGTHGGEIDTMITSAKDIRLINVWGYARLVGYTQEFQLEPDILESVDVEDGRTFTLKLREGHKWSDGHPFTTEDFRYWWEDIVNNKALTPSGPDPFMLVAGEPPKFEVIDETTVRFTWSAPNPQFLPALAQATPPFIYRPAHYLKQFHQDYTDPEKLAEMARAAKVRDWAPLHNQKDEMYRATNPDLPSLQPWVVTPSQTDRRFVMVRNPYFHRVTESGQQLPYVDRFVMSVVDGSLVDAKAQAGETDLQARGLSFADITVLKKGETSRDYTVHLWPSAKANEIALYPNLTTKDPMWRELFRDVRFRRALSLAIDRDLINNVLFFGLATPSANGVLPSSPLHEERFQTAWTQYDPDKANALLDEMGLTARAPDGTRLGTGGRPLEIIVETAGERTIEIDALELIKDTWAEIGVRLYIKPSQRDVMRNRAFSGDLVMSVWSGFDNGVPSADMPPDERVPVSTVFLSGPAWGAFVMSNGESGEEPDFEPASTLLELHDRWIASPTSEGRAEAWRDILDIHAEQVLSIGLVAGVAQPVVAANKLVNVPAKAVYGWDPGAHFGIYRPDEFFVRQ